MVHMRNSSFVLYKHKIQKNDYSHFTGKEINIQAKLFTKDHIDK